MPPLTTPRSSRGAKLKALQSIKVIAEKTIEFNRTVNQQPSLDTDVEFEPTKAQRRSLRLASQSDGGSPDTAIAIDSDEEIEPPKKLKAFCVGDAARVAVNKRWDNYYARMGKTRPQSRQTSQQPPFDFAGGLKTPEPAQADLTDFDFGADFAEVAAEASASAVEFDACSEQEATSASAADLVAEYALDTCSEADDPSTSASAAAFVSALMVDACPQLEADSDPTTTSASDSSSAPATPLATQSETIPTTDNAPLSPSPPSLQSSTGLASTPEVQCMDESTLTLLHAVMAVQAEAQLEHELLLHIALFGSPLDGVMEGRLGAYPASGSQVMASASLHPRSRSITTSSLKTGGPASPRSGVSSAPPSTTSSFIPLAILPSDSPTASTTGSGLDSDLYAPNPRQCIQKASIAKSCEAAVVMHAPLDSGPPALGGF